MYFNFGEYAKADFLLQEVIKKEPDNQEAAYWEALNTFYLYKRSEGESKKALAEKAQSLLLCTLLCHK